MKEHKSSIENAQLGMPKDFKLINKLAQLIDTVAVYKCSEIQNVLSYLKTA